jgi:uncharacterized RDD family membrane protein YckC
MAAESAQPPARRRGPLPTRLLERGTEEALVRALESEAVERAIIRVLESGAADRVLANPAVERAVIKALDSRLVDHAWDHLLASEEAQKLVERIAEAPEVRAAIASQGVGLLDDIGRQIREVAGHLDDAVERVVRRLTGHPRTEPTRSVGLVTRSLAFLIDAAILNGIFLGVAALLGFVISALFEPNGVSAAGIVFGAGAWIVVGSIYLVTFWALAGQTPGMRVLSIRIEADGSRRLCARRAFRRLVGAFLSALPVGLGFLGVITRDDRRGYHDRRAGTEVVRVDPVAAPWSRPVRSE